jgi:hypothetical protein
VLCDPDDFISTCKCGLKLCPLFYFNNTFYVTIFFYIKTGHAVYVHRDVKAIITNIGLWFMVFNATFNNIFVISWQSVLLVEKTRVPGNNKYKWLVKSFTVSNLIFFNQENDIFFVKY